MLKEILSITGKPGLYKLLATNKNTIIVESLADKKRSPIYATDKVASLKEITIYTQEGGITLGDALDLLYKHQEGKPIDLTTFRNDKNAFFDLFEKVVPSYDKEMVHANEIKKILGWYNLLIQNGFKSFANISEEKQKNEESKES